MTDYFLSADNRTREIQVEEIDGAVYVRVGLYGSRGKPLSERKDVVTIKDCRELYRLAALLYQFASEMDNKERGKHVTHDLV